jgi:hypothetical protein
MYAGARIEPRRKCSTRSEERRCCSTLPSCQTLRGSKQTGHLYNLGPLAMEMTMFRHQPAPDAISHIEVETRKPTAAQVQKR